MKHYIVTTLFHGVACYILTGGRGNGYAASLTIIFMHPLKPLRKTIRHCSDCDHTFTSAISVSKHRRKTGHRVFIKNNKVVRVMKYLCK